MRTQIHLRLFFTDFMGSTQRRLREARESIGRGEGSLPERPGKEKPFRKGKTAADFSGSVSFTGGGRKA